MLFNHLLDTARVFRYAAPPGAWHRPRRIDAGCEEIEVIVAGHGDFEVDGEVIDVGPGALLWYCAGETVAVTAHPRDPYLTVVFEFVVTEHLPPPSRVPRLTYWGDLTACRLFCASAFNVFHAGVGDAALFTGYHYARLRWEAQQASSRARYAELPLPLRRACAHLQQHWRDPLTVEMLAEVSGVSVSHLHLLFRTWLHTSPGQALLDERIMRARELLVATDLSIKEIGFATGFRNPAHFCRTFKHRVQRTPTAYRQQYIYPAPLR